LILIYLNNASIGYPKSAKALAAFVDCSAKPPLDIRHTPTGLADVPNARRRISLILGCKEDEVCFLADATTAINAVIRGVLAQPSKCVVDNRPHNAITRTLHAMPWVDWGIIPLYSEQEQVDISAIKNAPSDAKLICLTHASNVTGAIYPLPDLIAHFKKRCPNAVILVDAAQSVGIVDLSQLSGADFLVSSGHKNLHSVSGAAVLVAKRKLPPLLFGGTGTASQKLSVESDESNFVEVGTPNIAAILALAAAFEEWQMAKHSIASVICDRRDQLLAAMQTVPYLRPISHVGQSYTGIVALATDRGFPESEWLPFLRHNGIAARGGLHCAPVQHQQLGLLNLGTIRLSVSRFTTPDEIVIAGNVLRDCAQFIGSEISGGKGYAPVKEASPPTGIHATITSHKPCADLTDAIEISGTFSSGTQVDISHCLQINDWRLLNPSSDVYVFIKRRAMIFVDNSGAFTLSRIDSLNEAYCILGEAGIIVRSTGTKQ
jgi:cysteine desulfurase / selenocysteine lyase